MEVVKTTVKGDAVVAVTAWKLWRLQPWQQYYDSDVFGTVILGWQSPP
jgi:hypothetical protein